MGVDNLLQSRCEMMIRYVIDKTVPWNLEDDVIHTLILSGVLRYARRYWEFRRNGAKTAPMDDELLSVRSSIAELE